MGIELICGNSRDLLTELQPALIITDAPKGALVWLWEFAEKYDCVLIDAYSRNWIVGPNGAKDWQRYVPLIESTSGTVCDPFMGSGAIGAACIALGRDYIGIEIDKVRFEQANARLSRVV